METVITINVVEWVLYLVVIWLALSLADSTLALYKRYLEWRIKKLKERKKQYLFIAFIPCCILVLMEYNGLYMVCGYQINATKLENW